MTRNDGFCQDMTRIGRKLQVISGSLLRGGGVPRHMPQINVIINRPRRQEMVDNKATSSSSDRYVEFKNINTFKPRQDWMMIG